MIIGSHLLTLLNWFGFKYSLEPICDRLRNSKLEEVDLIVSLLDSLNKVVDSFYGCLEEDPILVEEESQKEIA